MDLSLYHGKRIAIVFQHHEDLRVVRGRAQFIPRKVDGNAIRIALEGGLSGNPELVIHEDEWCGEIRKDDEFGCDYRLEVDRRAS